MFIFKDKNSKIKLPWFILFFVLAMLANTYLSIPANVSKSIVFIAKKALVVTLFFIGSGLSVDAVKTVGIRPILLGVLLWVFIGVVALLAIM